MRKGKRTLEWDRIRRELRTRFEEAGITRCELGYQGCWRDNALSFAHTDKRRFLKGDQLYEVVLACISCHQTVELLPRSDMSRVLRQVIAKRVCQP